MARPLRPDQAAILRAHGEAALATHALNRTQMKAWRAITACRTAALGGHVTQCDACGDRRHVYHSCLMGSLPLWGVESMKRRNGWAGRVRRSPLRLRLQQRNQPVRWPELALAKVGRHDCLNGVQLLAGVSANVDFCRGQVAVAQPERHLPDVLRGL